MNPSVSKSEQNIDSQFKAEDKNLRDFEGYGFQLSHTTAHFKLTQIAIS